MNSYFVLIFGFVTHQSFSLDPTNVIVNDYGKYEIFQYCFPKKGVPGFVGSKESSCTDPYNAKQFFEWEKRNRQSHLNSMLDELRERMSRYNYQCDLVGISKTGSSGNIFHELVESDKLLLPSEVLLINYFGVVNCVLKQWGVLDVKNEVDYSKVLEKFQTNIIAKYKDTVRSHHDYCYKQAYNKFHSALAFKDGKIFVLYSNCMEKLIIESCAQEFIERNDPEYINPHIFDFTRFFKYRLPKDILSTLKQQVTKIMGPIEFL